MKRVVNSHHTERVGIHAVAIKIHEELGWLFREQSEDYGIDAQIEVVRNGEPSGKMLAAQIKSGRSYFAKEDAKGIVFHGDQKHLKYWLANNLPVIVILYDPDTKTAFWQHVTAANVTQMPTSWKLSIPRAQKLERSQADSLESIASVETKEQLEKLKAALQEFKCPYCGAPLAERGGDWVGSEHYGLHEIFCCGYHALDGFVKRPCPSNPDFPTLEDYEIEFMHGDAETESLWYCFASPKTDMAQRLPLPVSAGRTKEEAEQMLRGDYQRLAQPYKA